MKKKLCLVGIVGMFILAMSGCGAGAEKGVGSEATPQSPTASAGIEASGMKGLAKSSDESVQEEKLAFPRKIIYTGDLRLICDNLDIATEKLESRINQFGGYISNANKSGNRGSTRESTWTIRLPASKFDSFIKFAVSIGELQSNNRQAQDVSEEFYDVEARLKNKKVEEERLVELLKHATGKLGEILTVEKELSRVREESERIEGRLRFLKNQTDLSTITVTIQEVKNFQPEGPPTLKTQISRSFSGSIDTMKQVGTSLLLFVVAISPWVVPILLLIWLVSRKKSKGGKPAIAVEQNNDPDSP